MLQLEQRCVENTKQMFGLRIQNNMYLTLQFKKLNSNMCLVGFPENIESCSTKLNKHNSNLWSFPTLPSSQVLSNYFQTPSFSELGTFHMYGLMRQLVILANTITHSGHSLFPIALYTFRPLDLSLCCFCA